MLFFFKKNQNLTIYQSLQKVPGVGPSKAKYICKKIGFLIKTKWVNLSQNQKNNFIFWIEENVAKKQVVGFDLTKQLKDKIKAKIRLNNYNSIRIKKKLPLNGQRTRTNAKTIKKQKIW